MLSIILLCIICAIYWLWCQYNLGPDEPPLLKGSWPIVGHLPYLIFPSKHWQMIIEFVKMTNNLGGVARVRINPKPVYVVSDPDVMLKISNVCLEKSDYYDIARPFFGEGLITSRVSAWKQHRKHLFPAFNQIILDSYMTTFNSQSRKCIKWLHKKVGKGPFDPLAYFELISIETTGLTVLEGNSSKSFLMGEFVEAYTLLLFSFIEKFLKFWWNIPQAFHFSKLKKEQESYMKVVQDASSKLLQNKISALNKITYGSQIPESTFKSFTDILVELIQKGMISNRQARDHVNTIAVATVDTSAAVLALTTVLLGSHPEIQDKLFAEIREVLGDEDRDIKKQDLAKLVYLGAVIKESMRLYPPVPMVGRMLEKDVKLDNCTLYAGRHCVFFLLGINKHLTENPDQYQFRPERWLEKPSSSMDAQKTMLSFGLGRRKCIGKTYAMMSLMTTLAHLIYHYQFTADISQLRIKYKIMIKVESKISIEKRN